MRAVALLSPFAAEHHIRQFAVPGVNIFSGNELDRTDRPDAVLIFGGDGTVHRHLGSLAMREIPALIVPLGSANDFAHSIGICDRTQAFAAWQHFCARGDNLRDIDLGTVRELSSEISGDAYRGEVPWQGESLETLHFVPSGPRHDLPKMGPRIMRSQLRRMTDSEAQAADATYFCCIAGSGIDAAVNRLTLQQPRWLRGHGGYVVGLLRVLGGFRPPQIKIAVLEKGEWHTRVDEPGFVAAVGNGPQYGHGMRLTHEAQMDDGLLDVCFVRSLNKFRLLRLFNSVYSGSHIGLREVDYFRAERVRLRTDPVLELFADGEYVCRTPVELGVERGALRLIVSEG